MKLYLTLCIEFKGKLRKYILINNQEILSTIEMIENENLDVRTITMGISLLDCIDTNAKKSCDKIIKKITSHAKDLVKKPEERRKFAERILENKVVGWVKEAIKLDEKEVSADEFNKLIKK